VTGGRTGRADADVDLGHRVLTGYDPADPAHRITLQAAVLGARALDWPVQPLPAAG
jgi:hypothetical protein